MRVLRKVCAAAAAAALSVGLIAVSAPAADADTSWGGRPILHSTTR
jgi:Spy/CpxP family protein refolding chaperone